MRSRAHTDDMHNQNNFKSQYAVTEWTDVAADSMDESLEASVRGLRFPFDLSLRYKAGNGLEKVEGVGRTIDISNGGIRFNVNQPQTVGSNMELYITWPGPVDGCAVQLYAAGEIVRSDKREAVLRIRHHEFRTKSRAEFSVASRSNNLH